MNENILNSLLKELKQKANKDQSANLSRFFKTGPGQYGEGDKFLGIMVPESRKLAIKYSELSLSDVQKLLTGQYHEARLIAILILVQKYKSRARQGLAQDQKKIVDFYLKNTKYINNWDLVDQSASYILGNYLINRDRKILIKLAMSKNLWERRIAIIATLAFIYEGESTNAFKITKILINDSHDLIHKACGWMLREVGKRVSGSKLTTFLDSYGTLMPRTMLRYAIERLSEKQRLFYLRQKPKYA